MSQEKDLVSGDVPGFIPTQYPRQRRRRRRRRRRQRKSNAPLYANLPGIYLTEPFAELIAKRLKKAIVKTKQIHKYLHKEILVCGKYVYGSIILNEPLKVTVEQFDRLYDRHKISSAQREWWWPNAKSFYVYNFKIVKIHKEPLRYKHNPKAHTFIKNVELIRNMKLYKFDKSNSNINILNELQEEDLYRYADILDYLCERVKRKKLKIDKDLMQSYLLTTLRLTEIKLDMKKMPQGGITNEGGSNNE